MKVSWCNIGESDGSFDHHHLFDIGDKRDGRGPRDFMLHLIKETEAVAVAFNGKKIWDVYTQTNPEVAVVYGMMGEMRDASALIVVDYTVDGDWIDSECRACGGLYGSHTQCSLLSDIDKGWSNMLHHRVADCGCIEECPIHGRC